MRVLLRSTNNSFLLIVWYKSESEKGTRSYLVATVMQNEGTETFRGRTHQRRLTQHGLRPASHTKGSECQSEPELLELSDELEELDEESDQSPLAAGAGAGGLSASRVATDSACLRRRTHVSLSSRSSNDTCRDAGSSPPGCCSW